MESLYKEPIVDELVDESLRLYPNHTIFTHLGCVLLRLLMGMCLIESSKYNGVILVVLALAIISFGSKYLRIARANKKILWKFYPRMVLAYSMAVYYIKTGRPRVAGLLVIVDALMGFQSRHMASVTSFAIETEKKKVDKST